MNNFPPKIDCIVGITLAEILKGQSYPEHYASEDDVSPLTNVDYMEWTEDWFDMSTKKPVMESGDFSSFEQELTAKKSGYLVLEYNLISAHPQGITAYEIEMTGSQEFLDNFKEEIIGVYAATKGFENQLPEKTIALVFGASCHTDWETGYDECEPDYLGYLDWKTGEIT